MEIVIAANRAGKRAWWRTARRVREADERQRYLIVWYLATSERSGQVARRLGCARATVLRVAARFRAEGEPGLRDHRRHNGRRVVTDGVMAALARLLAGTPPQWGWARPTWTQELLLRQLTIETGVPLGRTTLRRLLGRLRARRGRPRPVVCCPWPAHERDARLGALRRLAAHPPPGAVVLFADEVDIHLNPKLGYDWMLPGRQKRVVTPGKNAKRYVAGALNAETGRLLWVSGERKTSALFLDLLAHLLDAYPAAATIQLILDNYGIHTRKAVHAALAAWTRRVRLHFLPPYCPSANRIERVWLDLHAAVTRNHRHAAIADLLAAVDQFLHARNRDTRHARRVHTSLLEAA
jgi:transposase